MNGSPLDLWIYLEGSLTQALRQVLPQLCVTLLSEEFSNDCWQRDTLLCDGIKPYVFARTQLPKTSPFLSLFQSFGTRPVGDWLYAQANLQKQPFRVLTASDIHAFLKEIPHTIGPVQERGRYTRYLINQNPIEIKELFLEIPPCR